MNHDFARNVARTIWLRHGREYKCMVAFEESTTVDQVELDDQVFLGPMRRHYDRKKDLLKKLVGDSIKRIFQSERDRFKECR